MTYAVVGEGMSASATSPSASNAAPPQTAYKGGSRRSRGRTASVAAGSTLTIAAPPIGEYPQTVITRRTARKSTPTRAPKSRPRQTFAGAVRRSMRRQPSSSSTGGAITAAISASPATGAWATKIARQSNAWVSAPPSAGPSAAPNVPASVQTAAPALADPVSPTSIGKRAGEQQRRADSLDAPRRDQERQATGRRAGDGRSKKEDEACGENELAVDPVHEQHERERRDRDGDVVRSQHPRHALDRGVELAVELRQRENDDRGVGEGETDDRGEKTHGDTIPPSDVQAHDTHGLTSWRMVPAPSFRPPSAPSSSRRGGCGAVNPGYMLAAHLCRPDSSCGRAWPEVTTDSRKESRWFATEGRSSSRS